MARTDYERIAGRYDASPDRHLIDPDPDLAERLGDTAAVLDVGCGTGNWLRVQSTAFADAPIRWVGVDASEGMLAQARKKLPGAELQVSRAEGLPFADATMDFVVTTFTFHHFEGKDAALDELVRVARPGAIVKLRNICAEHMPDWWVFRFFPEATAVDEGRFWTAAKIHEAFEARGLAPRTEVRVRLLRRPLADILEEARERTISELALLADADFEAGIARLEAAVAAEAGASYLGATALVTCTGRRAA